MWIMPLNAGDPGYGTLPGAGAPGPAAGDSEETPLLIPETEPVYRWEPLSKAQLEAAAGGPGWRRARSYLVLVFWISWMAMLATAISIIVISPRPEATPLRWWQRSLFYQLQPQLGLERSGGIQALCEELPYLSSLGIGALVLEGVFDKEASALNLTVTGERFGTLDQVRQLLAESSKANLKVVLDLCELNVTGTGDESSNSSASVHHALRFWLEQGVAGFAICDTDAAYSEKSLLEWRGIFREFSSEEDRIVLVKQTRDALTPLNNVTLIDVVLKSILPDSHHLLSAEEVAYAIETKLQTREEDIWPSWTVGGKASHELKKLLLVLTLTLPGSPVVHYDEDIEQTQNVSLRVGSLYGERADGDRRAGKEDTKRSTVALFTSLSRSRAREEALLFGSFTFLPFNSSSNTTSSSSSSSATPVLAFLRSWGCVHFLILLNVGPEPRALDPAWAPSLPKAGVFVTSTGLDRMGSVALNTVVMQPHEAIVMKLFEGGSYS